jgi:O-antigen biosynthesis protein
MTASAFPSGSRAGCTPSPIGRKHVIYTCVTNGYSQVLAPPVELRPHFDFILLSDSQIQVEGWRTLPCQVPQSDPRRIAKYYKILPHRIFVDHDASIWVDGNFQLHQGLLETFRKFLESDQDAALLRHRSRRCIYEEAKECLRWGKDNPDTIESQIRKYQDIGHPRNCGLFMGGIILRKHNAAACIRTMEAWWREIEVHSVRDQLSLPVVLRMHGLSVMTLPFEHLRHCATVVPHRKYRSYSLRGRNLLNPRAWLAPLIYRIATTFHTLRNRSSREQDR